MLNNYVAIVPARGGSKGLPKKNILEFNNKPLIYWTIEFIRKSGLFTKCITTTDDSNIAEIATKCGSEVPFLRAKELSEDYTSSSEVIIDVISKCSLKDDDIIFLFEPTSPYRKFIYLKKIINMYEIRECEFAVSVYEAMSKSYIFQYLRDDKDKLINLPFNTKSNKHIRRQDVPPTFYLDGSFYSAKVSSFKKNNSFISNKTKTIFTDLFTSLEIDTIEDFTLLECLFKQFGPPY